ncbi:MAG: putative transcriptional regulator [Firmicutes bacterium]|nr:putative transcriptional regulator [Bacillota bacterium]
MLIKELSEKTGASIRSIRYYEEQQLIQASRLPNGYRWYDDSAIERVKTIQLYLSLGLNSEDIAAVIECPAVVQTNRPLCKAAYDLYRTKLLAVNKQIELLDNVRKRLEGKIEEFEVQSKNTEESG